MSNNRTHEVIARNAKGEVVCHTWHVGESSKDMEISAWKDRIRKKETEAIEIEVLNLVDKTKNQFFKAYP